MPRLLLLLIAALPTFLAAPAQAEPATAGPVERLVLAHRLFATGQAERDGLSQIAAARIAASVALQTVERKPEVEGKGTPKAAAIPPDAARMLEGAKAAVAADETLGIFLTSAMASAEVLPKGSVRSSAAALAPGQAHRYRLPADGGVKLDLGVVTDGLSQLEIEAAAGDAVLCRARGYCGVTLVESGFVTVTLRNPGPEDENYLFLSN